MREGKVLLVANPTAQHGNGAELARIARELLGRWLGDDNVEYVSTQRQGHASDVAAGASRSRYAAFIALGGDGLVHESVNGLMRLPRDERPVFGLVPAGSGNDFAKTLGMSENVPDAIVQFLDARVRELDVGCVNGEHFAQTLSFGLDAAIALDTVERRKRTGQSGVRLYLASGIDQLLHHLDAYRFKAVLDGSREISGDVLMMAVQNGPTYGGGFRICPKADPADGLLDICYATAPMGVVQATYKFLRAKDGKHVRSRGIRFERASRIELAFEQRPPCQVDGEPLTADSFDVALVSRALAVLCAAKV